MILLTRYPWNMILGLIAGILLGVILSRILPRDYLFYATIGVLIVIFGIARIGRRIYGHSYPIRLGFIMTMLLSLGLIMLIASML